jgi:dihydrofolate reductase
MKSNFEIFGFAIVSVDGMIADANQVLPESLKYEADHLFFEQALSQVDLILHGRHSHEGHAESDRRRRLWLTHSVADLAPDPAGGRQWLWNPAGVSLEDACRSVGLEGGIVAILGGTSVYDLFLPRYDVFHLSRAGQTRIPDGTPVFSGVAGGLSPELILSQHGLAAQPAIVLDAANEVTMTRWRRLGGGPEA